MGKLSNNPPVGRQGKVVLFDIDYTLFDAECFRGKLYEELSRVLDLEKAEIERVGSEAYEHYRKKLGYFNPALFLDRFTKKLGASESSETIERAIWEEGRFRDCLYVETTPVLVVLEGIATIGIFSKGHSRFQRAKLSRIARFFEKQHVHIHVNKEEALPKILKKYNKYKLYLVDDALEVLHQAKKKNRTIFTIWVKRGRYARIQKPIAGFTPDAVVPNLRGVITLVRYGRK